MRMVRTRSALVLGLGLCLMVFGARRSMAASADEMDYFYQAYTSLKDGYYKQNADVPSFDSVQSALAGDPLYGVPSASDSLTYDVYDLAVADYEKQLAAYNQANDAANAVQNRNMILIGRWETKLTNVAKAAYATLSGYDSEWAQQMSGDYLNVGIPSFAVNIILGTDFLRGVTWFQIPPYPTLQPLPPVPDPPFFPFILANYLTAFHFDSMLQSELDEYNHRKLGPGLVVPVPGIGDAILDDYENLPKSLDVPQPVTQDQLNQYENSLNATPTYSYPPMPSGPDFGSVNANVNLANPHPTQASPVSAPTPTSPVTSPSGTPSTPPVVQPPSNSPSETPTTPPHLPS